MGCWINQLAEYTFIRKLNTAIEVCIVDNIPWGLLQFFLKIKVFWCFILKRSLILKSAIKVAQDLDTI